MKALDGKNVSVVVGDSTMPVAELTKLLKGFDTVISSIDAGSQLAQFNLVDAAAAAGVKRFVPCGFTTICPPGGIMVIRDHKEEVHNRIFRHHLPYTIIDVGFWHVISYPDLPSGRTRYASNWPEEVTIYGDGNAPNLLTDAQDIGKYVALIIKDERTLNKRVVTWSDELSQRQIIDIMEDLSGEKIPREKHMSYDELKAKLAEAHKAYDADPKDNPWSPGIIGLFQLQYLDSKYFRKDNTLENAKYLGYVDAKQLYPDFKPVSFADFVKNELLAGKAVRPYARFSK